MLDADNNLHLEVIDNGVGFVTNQEFPGHLGLRSMRERVDQLSGSISIHSSPGEGTHLTVLLPLPNAKSAEQRRRESGTHRAANG